MNAILKAMDATVELAELRGMNNIQMPGSCLSYDHVKDMQRQMHERPADGGKLNRWLGWAQCAVVASGCASLDDMRGINKRHISCESSIAEANRAATDARPCHGAGTPSELS